jgi:hypothetical protein
VVLVQFKNKFFKRYRRQRNKFYVKSCRQQVKKFLSDITDSAKNFVTLSPTALKKRILKIFFSAVSDSA